MTRIYLSPPHVSGEERRLLLDAFDSNWIAPLGPHVDGFEREFAEAVGVPYAAALSSGTAALHLALLLLDVGRGDEVLTSTLTFAATANAITYRGAVPVFIDASRDTWTMDPDLLREELEACAARGKPPKAVVVVDLYGQCADYDAIVSVCEDYGVPIVEDAAEALGSTYRGRSAGAFGSLAAFSFNGNKIITTSGGGMLVSHRSDWIARARFLSTQARDNAPHYQHSEIGYNYRMSNLLAAVGRGQLRNLPDRVLRRRANAAFYQQALTQPGLSLMPEAPYGRSNRWLTCILVEAAEFGASPEQIRTHLETKSIETRPIWKPMHLQPAFAGCRARGGAVSQDLFERGLCLPSGSSLSAADRNRIVETMLDVPQVVAGVASGRRQVVVPHPPSPVLEAVKPRQARFVPAKRRMLQYGRVISVAVQLAIVCLSNIGAFFLRFDGNVPDWAMQSMLHELPWLMLSRGLVFIPFRVYEGIWRFTGVYDLRGLIGGIATSSIVFFVLVTSVLSVHSYPRSIFFIDALLLLCALGGLRLASRYLDERRHRRTRPPVLIVGAGNAGELVARDMIRDLSHGMQPVGFVDDDPEKHGRRIHGVPVLGGRQDLPRILSEHPVGQVVIAIPSASPATIRDMLRDFEPFKVQIKTLPTLRDLLRDRVGVGQLREMRMEDLLQRAPIGLDPDAVRSLISGRRVLITGAGGTMGAELARQVSALAPGRLVLLERSDRALNSVCEQVSSVGGRPVAVLANVGNRKLVFEAFERHKPDLVFHAAVQNDVPLIEENPAAAVRSNVLGTRVVADACRQYKTGRMILLSTTKAVNPNTVMGATRRVAEMIVGAGSAEEGVLMCGVRLGNVLGRPGSVVPIFGGQIDAGGPVTVSHPDIRRYFMLTSEMVQLVLHAASAAEPGTMYVLDMGEQIKILDLARDLIRLKGFIPDEEIQIQFTGLWRRERLFEELANRSEIIWPSSVERILRVRGWDTVDPVVFDKQLDQLVDAGLREDSDEVRRMLGCIVPEFSAE